MLIPKGEVIHENLSTAFTHIDQLVTGLEKKQLSGLCLVSFWEYEGILFFDNGHIVNGCEDRGTQSKQQRIGDDAIASILMQSREKEGEISVYQLPAPIVFALVAALNATTKYEELSTDLTSLDKLSALLEKEHLSGYIEVLLEHDAGIANLFFTKGTLIATLLESPDHRILAETTSLSAVHDLCHTHGAIFNVYQAPEVSERDRQENPAQKTVSLSLMQLFERLLIHLETVTDSLLKPGAFQAEFKALLPQAADRYPFLDPFIGDFRYANQSLSYRGDATSDEFVDGLCDVINTTLTVLLTKISRQDLLPQISRALEPVSTAFSELIDELELETRLPQLFQDYSFLQKFEGGSKNNKKEAHTVLNLQGIGISEIGSDSILKEFYRVISLLAEKYVDPVKNVTRYAQIKSSREFQLYQTATALLQQFDLSYLKDRPEQCAFWLNLYNFLVIDGILEFGVKTSVQGVKGFFAKTSYRLHDLVFSLDDIEHGILRNNQRRPYSMFRQFNPTDPRKALCLTPMDKRVHCCFSCAARSGPALAVYTADKLDEQLDQAATRFLSTHGFRLDRDRKEVWLNRTFYWYRKDFEQQGHTLLDFVSNALKQTDDGRFIRQHQSELTLRFMDYDWSLNGE